jgi:glycosyltransferase involved in cell wall biosynthesis
LRAADIFALASVTDRQGASDVFPTVIIEAMAAARPVVSTRTCWNSRIGRARETGLLVAHRRYNAPLRKRSGTDPESELRSHYGRTGRARIEQHFESSTQLAPLLGLFEEPGQIGHAALCSGCAILRRAGERTATENHQIAY